MKRMNPSSMTASPAVSSLPDLPESGGLCAIHQPNLFPRLTTLAKLFAADYWIVLDDVQFTRRDYQHRARLGALEEPDRRQWLTVPTHLPHGRRTLIRDALIDDPGRARRSTAGMLRQHVPRPGTLHRRGHRRSAVPAADDQHLVLRSKSEFAVGVGGTRPAGGGRPYAEACLTPRPFGSLCLTAACSLALSGSATWAARPARGAAALVSRQDAPRH
ncbi:WbqC family protein [Streptomyces niveus]|uniref:WbqC family protein n=1 Tax=Streptomyces niveus TaxID=193462 RepID=UPI0036632251